MSCSLHLSFSRYYQRMHRLQSEVFMFFIICHALLSILLLASICFSPVTSSVLSDDEAMALKQMVTEMGGEWVNSNTDPCQSRQLNISNTGQDESNKLDCNCQVLNSTTCHVTSITLTGYSLPGILPVTLVRLPYLQAIEFDLNYLHDSLPKQWASMKSLTRISIAGNRISGEIPKEWGNFTNLTDLILEANQLSGNIPAELGNLVNLNSLILSSNQFDGTLPEELAELKSLTDFRISDNNLSGSLPDYVQDWIHLIRLELYATGLSGPVPAGIFHLKNLNDLRISDMAGPISEFPNPLPSNDNLKYLVLRNLNLSGELPLSIWEMNNLEMLDVSFNKLQGEVLSRAQLRKFTFLSGNMLAGNVTSAILGTEKNLDLSYNNFIWPPDCQERRNINSFRGSSPMKNLSGLLPCSGRSKCSKYYSSLHINCGGENVTIENQHGKILYEGDKDGVGPSRNYVRTNWGFSSTGDFMDDDSDAPNLYTGSNSSKLSVNLSESYMTKLYMTSRISPLSLTYYGFCLENINYTVSLHFAEIKFRDDESYSSLGRRIFDIYIQGKLEWKDFNIMKEANGRGKSVTKQINVTVIDHTLEIRLYWAGKGTTWIPKRGTYGALISAISVCPSTKSSCAEPVESRKIPITAGVATSAALLLVLVVLGWLYCWFKGKNMRRKDLKGLDPQAGSFTLRQIKAATNNFDPANKIGEGGFGCVYKGELSNGTVIAVKQLSSKSRQGNREFVNELGIISGLQHPNLVKLYGCCIEGDQLLLVYEYMENNCLARALFGGTMSVLELDWKTRSKICIGIARGLVFLHEESALRIVHRDIKGTNILLDRDLNARISDFGLAKLNEADNTHISTRVAGTIGYMAPEYALWGYLTDKADVYSFGVVTLEIVSGQNNSVYRPENGYVCLLEWASVLQQNGSLMELVDPKLGSKFDKEEAERMIKIGLLCTNITPALRPTMSAVVSMLKGETIVPNLNSDPTVYRDVRFQALRDRYRQMQMKNSDENQPLKFSSDEAWAGASSSTSAQDLYPNEFLS